MGIIDGVLNGLKDLGPYGVFIGVVLENIFTPIPSALIPLMAGAVMIPSDTTLMNAIILTLISIGLVGAIASTISTIPFFVIGYVGGKKLIDKYGRYVGISWRDIEKAKGIIEDMGGGDSIVILSRIIPIIPISPVSIALGIMKYEAKRFVFTTIIGTLIRYLTLGFIGCISKDIIWTLTNIIETMETTIIITAIILIVVYMVKRDTIIKYLKRIT